MSDEPRISETRPVGRYALGIAWMDGHDSILTHASLRGHCPCDACEALRERDELPGGGKATLEALEHIGDASVFLRWSDGHETFYLVPELRALCRCAYCIGEPERPITGG
jgi:DUF971 family protein